MKNWIIAALVAVIAIGGSLGAFAATQTVETTETVEVRFWQGVNDNSVLWYKARPEGGDWTPITRLRMPDFDRSGNYHQGDIAIDVPITVSIEVPDPPPVETAEPPPTTESETASLSADMEQANLWVFFRPGGTDSYPRLEASVLTFVDMEAFDLNVYVASGARAGSFCAADPIFSDHVAELGCTGLRDVQHDEIDSVHATYTASYESVLRYDCARQSTRNPLSK